MRQLNHLLLYDGYCNLCNGLVRFVLRNESDNQINFAPLNSSLSQEILKLHKLQNDNTSSVVFLENGIVYQKSAAVLKIINHLNWPWTGLRIFKWIPTFISDFGYDVIARFRYRIFGKSSSCPLPETKWQHRFLE